jgi:preprotein translocase subunit SecD
MRRTRRTSYAAAVAIALAAATLAACGSSATGGSTPAGEPSATSSSPAAAGAGDLQLRQASSAQKPPTKACTSAPVAPATPTYRCDRDGTGYQLGPAFVTGAMVASAEAQQAETGPVVQVTLDAAGTQALAEATTRMAPLGPPDGLLGIMSGGRLYGAPLVQTPVLGGVFVIGGLANMADAVSLATAIRG